jgi:hypothetical protein
VGDLLVAAVAGEAQAPLGASFSGPKGGVGHPFPLRCEWLPWPAGACGQLNPSCHQHHGESGHGCSCLVLGSCAGVLWDGVTMSHGGANFPESLGSWEGRVNPTTCPQALAMNSIF